jgi:hypothetical protein
VFERIEQGLKKGEEIMTTMNLGTKVALAVMMGIGAVTLTTSASAADWNFSLGFGRPVVEYCAPVVVARPHTVRTWVPERYEKREEQVLVSPERHDRVWIADEFETHLDHYGRAHRVLVRPGYWKEVCIPAKYETRCTNVLIPGYWTEVAVNDRYDDRRYSDNRGDRNWDRRDDRNDYRRDDRDNDGRFDPHGKAYGHDKKEVAIKISARK